MSKSTRLRPEDWRALFRLVGECRELGDDPHHWRSHLVTSVSRLVGADLGSSGETGGHLTSEPINLGVTNVGYENCSTPAVIKDVFTTILARPELYRIVETYFECQAREDGVALSRCDVIHDRDWYSTMDDQFVHRSLGVNHVMWCFRSLGGGSGDECGGLMFFRARGRRDFSARDRAILSETQAFIVPLIGGPLYRFAEPSPGDLACRLRQVLACLLEGDGDKQIGFRLGLSVHTVNEYTKAIFRHFGVRSRPELLARWIRRGWVHLPTYLDDRDQWDGKGGAGGRGVVPKS